jgi:hypothetical protein
MLLNFELLAEYRHMLYCHLQAEAKNNEAVNFSDLVCHDTINFARILYEFRKPALSRLFFTSVQDNVPKQPRREGESEDTKRNQVRET